MPASAFVAVAEEEPDDRLPLSTFPFLFINFSLHSATNNLTHVDIPCSETDAHADLELPWIWEFLSMACKPDGLDDVTLKKFLKHATRFFMHSG